MGKEQKVQSERSKQIRRKKHLLHYLIVYLICLLVACVTWLSVRYSMRAEENTQLENASLCATSVVAEAWENTLYV